MEQRKTYLLRLDPAMHNALQRWADAELRSLNSQIEFLLRSALRQTGRLVGEGSAVRGGKDSQPHEGSGE